MGCSFSRRTLERRKRGGSWIGMLQEMTERLNGEVTRWKSPPGRLIESWLTGMTAEVEQSLVSGPRLTGEKKNLIGSCISFLKRHITLRGRATLFI